MTFSYPLLSTEIPSLQMLSGTPYETTIIFDIGATTAYKELDEMIEKGILERRGEGRATHYVLRTKRTKSERF